MRWALETKVIKEYIIHKLKEYAEIPSLSNYEDEFMNYLMRDFGTPEGMEWISVEVDGKQQAQFLHNTCDKSGLVFTVHTDRVPDADGNPYQNIIGVCEEDGTITGQLDDMIAIAILRYVIECGIKVNILFTTQEEICKSYDQVAWVADNFGLMPVSIDIDPLREFETGKDAAITIREKMLRFIYDPETVMLLHKTAIRNGIQFETEYGYVIDEVLLMMRAEKGTGCHLGIPLKRYHTNREEVKTAAVLSMIELISAIARANDLRQVKAEISDEILIN